MSPADLSLLRHRRAVEAGQLAARGFGILSTVLLVAGAFRIFPGGTPGALTLACLAMIAVMTAAEVVGAVNFRHPGGRQYAWCSAVQVAADLAVMCTFVAALRVYVDITTWTGLIVPIVAGALRFRLRGALATWAVTSAFLPFALHLGGHTVVPGDLAFAILINLIIAFISGTQSGAFARQIGELDEARRALEHQAGHDPLTGLPNRTRLARFADGEHGRELTVLLLDLDGFKQVNDELGHAAGDELLRETGQRIHAALRSGDLAGRVGGDEFQVLLPQTGPEEAADVIARLRAEITRPAALSGGHATVGVSIGAAHRQAGQDLSLDALAAQADRAMYREKSAVRRAGTSERPAPGDARAHAGPARAW
jgi:diguanylate cyclase